MPIEIVSRQQVEANRRNAARSTGPRTPEGKARSSRNAIKHGLLARDVVIREGDGAEDEAQFDAFLGRLWDDLQPVGVLEEALVERIAVCHWRLRRAQRFEVGAIRSQLDECKRPPVESEDRQPPPAWLEEYDPIPRHPAADDVEGKLERTKSSLDQAIEVSAWAEAGDDLTAPEAWKTLDSAWNEVLREHRLADTEVLDEPRRQREFAARLERHGLTGERLRGRLLKAQSAIVAHLRECVAGLQAKLEQARRYEKLAQERASLVYALPSEGDVNKLIRYETMINRELDRALNRLERLQRARLGDHIPAPVALDVNVTGVKEGG